MSRAAPQQEALQTNVLKMIGPGLIVAASGIGAGDIIASTVGGAKYGLILLWAIAIGALLKCVLNEGIARWQLANGSTIIEGWEEQLPAWVLWYFALYLSLWTTAVSAALAGGCGLAIENLTGGAVPRAWAGIAHALIACAVVWIGGFSGFEKVMKVLIGTMFFSMLICAIITFSMPLDVLKGLFVPIIPAGSSAYVLSLIGAVGGTVVMLLYNYWLREKNMVGPSHVRFVRADLAIAYVFTAVFDIAVMMVANKAFHLGGIGITEKDAVPKMAEMLGSIVGPAGFYIYSLGFWAAVFASMLGCWQGIPYIFADTYGLLRKYPKRTQEEATRARSRPYAAWLLLMTLVPIPFAFRNPLYLIITFTIVSALFMPFLAATLLYVNNRVPWTNHVPKNSLLINGMLVLIFVVFVAVGVREVIAAF
jgi:Mn2+/Fe2+ NRAMP family transporter